MPRTHVLLLLLLICQFDCCSCSEPCHDGKSKLHLREEEGIIAPPHQMGTSPKQMETTPLLPTNAYLSKTKRNNGGGERKWGRKQKRQRFTLTWPKITTEQTQVFRYPESRRKARARLGEHQLARNSQAPWLRCGRPQDKVCFDGPPQDPSVVYAY